MRRAKTWLRAPPTGFSSQMWEGSGSVDLWVLPRGWNEGGRASGVVRWEVEWTSFVSFDGGAQQATSRRASEARPPPRPPNVAACTSIIDAARPRLLPESLQCSLEDHQCCVEHSIGLPRAAWRRSTNTTSTSPSPSTPDYCASSPNSHRRRSPQRSTNKQRQRQQQNPSQRRP